MATCEIIAIGNELLSGDVHDSNTHWLCRQITGVGGHITRAATLPDEPDVITAAVRDAISRCPDLIVTAGGLGPTADDRTLASVAEATERSLEPSDAALAMVQATYDRLAHEGHVADSAMTDPRRKMAVLPSGAEPLANPVGAAPGVLLKLDHTTIVSLPGVPDELMGIVEGSLAPTLRDIFGSAVFAERLLIADCGDESVLAPLLSRVAEDRSDVHIKSRPRHFGPDVRIRITISARGDSTESVSAVLADAEDDLRRALESHDIGVVSPE